MKFRGGTAELQIETGRQCGLSRNERISKNWNAGSKKMLSTSCCTVLAWLRREGKWRS